MGWFSISGWGVDTRAIVEEAQMKDSTRVATTVNLVATYSSANLTLTADSNGAISIDDISLALDERALVKDQSTGSQNGIYKVTTVGDGSNPYVLTRTDDFNTSSDINSGNLVPINEGTVNADLVFMLITDNPIVLDTTALVFEEYPFSWIEVTGTSVAMAVNKGYTANNASLVTLSLPTAATTGKRVKVGGKGAGGWKIAQNANGIIHFGNQDSTTGTGGSLASTNRYDSVELLCVVQNNEWVVLSSLGNITIV